MAEIAVNYGLFINSILTFLIVAYAVFMVVKSYNRIKENMDKKEEEEEVPAGPSNEEVLLMEIRDLLKKGE